MTREHDRIKPGPRDSSLPRGPRRARYARTRRVQAEIHRLPIDPEPTPPWLPHPLELVRRDMDLLPFIAVGGSIGAVARWGMAQALPSTGFAWSTLLTNVVGCALIGVLMALMVDRWATTRYVRPFLGVGVLGGFTTFSTYTLDVHKLLVAGRVPLAGLYDATTLITCVVAVWMGLTCCRWVLDRAPDPDAERAEEAPA
ncbi:MAG: CrcB family protein [Nocardioidaceae bacterium]|nr:CrcB family protein [Nocardioidaceae bacterium]